MSHPLRYLEPGSFWFVTSRCIDARFLLRPDPALTALAGFCLARAARRFEGISLHGVIFMSNHFHLIVCDRDSELSDFMCAFNGMFAKAVNALRGRRGHVFARRFSAERILDEPAKMERLLYLTLNPVAANLVERHDDWLGLSLRSQTGEPEEHRYRYFNEGKFKVARLAAIRDGVPLPKRSDFEDEEILVVQPLLPAATAADRQVMAQQIEETIRAREQEKREANGSTKSRPLGMRRVLDQNPEHAPSDPKQSPQPLCHASTWETWKHFKALMRQIHALYVEASAAFRSGQFDITFPPHTFRPPGPLAALG